MKKIIFFLALSVSSAQAQQTENIILITTDGFRWQEVFKGLDTTIANNPKYNEGDSKGLIQRFSGENAIMSRKKILPFMWNEISKKGQIWGNRLVGNNMQVANPYWFSYPGYNEILSGYADTLINSNSYPPNPNITLPEFLQTLPSFKNKVMAFGAWDAFNRILNEERSGIPVVAAFDKTGGTKPTPREALLNKMLHDSYKPFGEEECLDVFTHSAAFEALQNKHPKFLYIAYGETDEWAHTGKYKSYIEAAHQVDQWIAEIWNFVQQDPFYKNKTTLIITTDHGRGDRVKEQWTSHGKAVEGSNEMWMAMIGPNIPAKGIITEKGNFYQRQIAQTIADILGIKYAPKHPTAEVLPYK